MRHIFLIAITVFGITTAQAQMAPTSGSGVGSDPLSVPTSSLPTGSSSSSGSASGGPVTAGGNSGTANANGTANGTAGVSASPSSNPQAPVLLPGEMGNTSSQAPNATAASPSRASTICPPPVPTTDGGSANLTDMVGESLSGC
jgi:hypothetical protein